MAQPTTETTQPNHNPTPTQDAGARHNDREELALNGFHGLPYILDGTLQRQLEFLGEGANGRVEGAMFTPRGQQQAVSVAIKNIYLLNVIDVQNDREQLAQLLREIRQECDNLYRLNSTHVVRFMGLIMSPADGLPQYIVMERLAPLVGHRDFQLPLAPARWIAIMEQIFLGLADLHAQGLVHRDIKPSNLLVDESTMKVKIGDFGCARLMSAITNNPLTQGVGTSLYMAPEGRNPGNAATAAFDVYSACVVGLQLATGRQPVTTDAGNNHREALERLGELSDGFATFVRERMEPGLAVNPTARPTVENLRESLHRWKRQSPRNWPYLLAAGATGALVVGGVGYYFIRATRPPPPPRVSTAAVSAWLTIGGLVGASIVTLNPALLIPAWAILASQ